MEPSINMSPEKLSQDTETGSVDETTPQSNTPQESPPVFAPIPNSFVKWNSKIESLAGLEARGITRVLPSERHKGNLLTDLQMAFLWFSANITANNLAVGLLGPLLFDLGFVDSALCSVFGSLLGCILTAYMSIWGAQSGNRTMVRNHCHAK